MSQRPEYIPANMAKRQTAAQRWAAYLEEMAAGGVSRRKVAAALRCGRHRPGEWARSESVPDDPNKAAIQDLTAKWAQGPILKEEWPLVGRARRSSMPVRPLVAGGN